MDNLQHRIGRFAREGKSLPELNGHRHFDRLALENVVNGRSVGLDPNIGGIGCVSNRNTGHEEIIAWSATSRG